MKTRVTPTDVPADNSTLWPVEDIPGNEWVCDYCHSVFLVHVDRTPSECPVCRCEDVTPFSEAHGS